VDLAEVHGIPLLVAVGAVIFDRVPAGTRRLRRRSPARRPPDGAAIYFGSPFGSAAFFFAFGAAFARSKSTP